MFKNFPVTIDGLSKNKVFEIKDLFIYAFIFLFVVALFIAPLFSKTTQSQGFSITINGEVVLTHHYGENDFEKAPEWASKIALSHHQDGYLIEITAQDGGFNLIYSNEKAQTVKVVDSDCPSGNCKHMAEIKNAGVIYCAPRDLKITPLIDSGDLPPVTGGGS